MAKVKAVKPVEPSETFDVVFTGEKKLKKHPQGKLIEITMTIETRSLDPVGALHDAVDILVENNIKLPNWVTVKRIAKSW